MVYTKRLTLLIGITFCLKIIASLFLELGNDEVYYYTYSLQPDFNHFDHPPLIGFLIRLTTLNLWWLQTTSLRLGAFICSAIATWQMFAIGSKLKNTKVGWYAALLFSISIYTNFIAGFFILPDSIQLPFWLAAIQIMVHIHQQKSKPNIGTWFLLGLSIGLAVLCKVHGLYLWVGFGLYILIKKRAWLLDFKLYASILTTIICCLPIYWWNVQNNFITYKFHGNRVAAKQIHWDSFLQEIMGELLYQNPILIASILLGFVALWQRKFFMPSHTKWLLLCSSIPMLFLFWAISLFNPTLPHWSGPSYITLYFIPAFYFEKFGKKLYPNIIQWGFGLIAFALSSFIVLANFSPINFGSQQKENYGEGCPTLDVSGWNNFGNAFALYANQIENKQQIQLNAPILIHKWFPAGHTLFYVATKAKKQVIAVGALQDVHKFAWLNKQNSPLQIGMDAYFILPSNTPLNVKDTYKKYFTTIEEGKEFMQIRSKKPVRIFTVYLLKNCKEIPPSPFVFK
jgi:Dolichyl-phosphate-mannose-protein mannosyltransferase